VKGFLAGEGPDELGDRNEPPQYRASPPDVGIVEALLHKLGVADLDVVGARLWKSIHKLRFKPPVRGEVQNVLGLMVEADEVGADVLVFVRDQDGYADRQDDVEEGIRQAVARGYGPAIVGGVAVQEIEAWILALLGERRTEGHADAKAVLGDRHGTVERGPKVAAVEGADLTRVPEDAVSLRTWLGRAAAVLVVKREPG